MMTYILLAQDGKAHKVKSSVVLTLQEQQNLLDGGPIESVDLIGYKARINGNGANLGLKQNKVVTSFILGNILVGKLNDSSFEGFSDEELPAIEKALQEKAAHKPLSWH